MPSQQHPALGATHQICVTKQEWGPEQQWVGATHLEVQGHEGDPGEKDLQQGKQID